MTATLTLMGAGVTTKGRGPDAVDVISRPHVTEDDSGATLDGALSGNGRTRAKARARSKKKQV